MPETPTRLIPSSAKTGRPFSVQQVGTETINDNVPPAEFLCPVLEKKVRRFGRNCGRNYADCVNLLNTVPPVCFVCMCRTLVPPCHDSALSRVQHRYLKSPLPPSSDKHSAIQNSNHIPPLPLPPKGSTQPRRLHQEFRRSLHERRRMSSVSEPVCRQLLTSLSQQAPAAAEQRGAAAIRPGPWMGGVGRQEERHPVQAPPAPFLCRQCRMFHSAGAFGTGSFSVGSDAGARRFQRCLREDHTCCHDELCNAADTKIRGNAWDGDL